MTRALGTALAVVLTLAALYLSRFWTFRLWGNDGLLGLEALRAGGDLVRTWLRGTQLAPFDIILWGLGVFLALTAVQAIWTRLGPH